MINLSFFFFLLSCLVSSRLSRTLSRDSKTQRERRFWGIFFLLMSRFFTQERSMTTTWPTWRETWTPSGISRSSARSCGWRTSNSWTAISRNWRNSLFEETTRSSSPNTWVWSNNNVYRRVALYKKQLQNLSSEIKRVVLLRTNQSNFRSLSLSPSFAKNFSKPPPLFLFQNISLSSIQLEIIIPLQVTNTWSFRFYPVNIV